MDSIKEPVDQVEQSAPSNYELLPKPLKVIVLLFAFMGVALAVIYKFGFIIAGQVLLPTEYYYLLFAFFLPPSFLIIAGPKGPKKPNWLYILASGLVFALCIYYFFNAYGIRHIGWIPASPVNLALGIIFIILVLISAYRIAGKAFLIVILVIGVYPLFANHMPSVLWGQNYEPWKLLSIYAYGVDSFLGIPASVIGNILIGFLVFAAVLIAAGAGKFFTELAAGLLGSYRGGAAKVAVLASAFFGSLSGSSIANIASTGSFTIPTMKRMGYPAHYAAAAEACASTGGPLMPPVMGTVAFIMAIFLGVDYGIVVVAAIIPAILYYLGLLVQIDAFAAKNKLTGLPKEELPSLKETLKWGWPFAFVLIFLIWGLIYMRMAALTPFYASALMIVLSYFNKKTRLTPKKLVSALQGIGRLVTQTLAVIMPVGIIIVAFSITGAAPRLASTLVAVAGENTFLILLIGGIACFIFGMMGMIAASYLFLAITMAPAAIQAGGFDPLPVHFFIIYYSVLGLITPPVAVGAFVAANIAGSPPMKTAFTSVRLGVVLYFIPFFFVYNPSLLFQGPFIETLLHFALCVVGVFFLASALEGYMLVLGRLRIWARPLIGLGGFLIALPTGYTSYIGAVLVIIGVIAILIIRRIRVTATA